MVANKKRFKKSVLLMILVLSFGLYPILDINETEGINPEPFFNIALLVSGSVWEQVACSQLMIDELAKIGIGVYDFDTDLSGDLIDRTWDHIPPIPTYENGGFDILFYRWYNFIDVNLNERFHSSEITTDGMNFYQYNNALMDIALENYTQSYLPDDKALWAGEIQKYLYEDLPSICLLYETWLYPMNENLDGFNGALWAEEHQNIGDWSIPGKNELKYAVSYIPSPLHIYMSEQYERQWLNQIYAGMIEREPEDRGYAPRIALSWNTTDGLTYNIQLDPNAKWADGQILNTSDVKFSFELISSPDFNSPHESFWMQYIDSTSITIIDEFNMEIEFLKEYTFQESNLALPIIPRHIWSEIPINNHSAQAVQWIKTDPSKIIGAGPYFLYNYNETQEIVHLKRNPYYKDLLNAEEPAFEDVYFIDYDFSYFDKEEIKTAIQSGDVDIADGSFRLLPQDIAFPGISYEQVNILGRAFEMGFNLNHPYFGTGSSCPISGSTSARYIRKAISHIIPRDHIIEEIFDGLGFPGVTVYPPIGFGYNVSMNPSEYNVTLAKQYMEAAGFEYQETTTSLRSTSVIALVTLLGLIGGFQRLIKKKKYS